MNPRMLRSVIDRLPDVSSEQKQKIVELMKQFDEAMSAQKDMTPAQRDEQNKRVSESMLNVLTPEQRERVQSRMEGRAGPMRRRPDSPPEGQSTEKP
jgi:Spy/CpxP family protein refolding chaperone